MKLLILILVVWGVYAYMHMAPLVKAAQQAAGQATPFTKQEGDLHVLFLGDSTAFGVGAETPEVSTAGHVSRVLSAAVDNEARSGARVADAVEQLKGAPGERYDAVVIQVGANDIMYFSSLAEATAQLRVLLAEAKKKSDRVVLLTCGDLGTAPLWPWPVGAMYTYRTKQFRSAFMATAQEFAVAYVDIFSKPDVFSSDPHRYYAPDGLHLSGEGYRVWATYILEALGYEEKLEV